MPQFVMSALPPKANIRPRDQDVCFGPKVDMAPFDSGLVGATSGLVHRLDR